MIERGKESNMNLYTKEEGEIGGSDHIKRENVRVCVCSSMVQEHDMQFNSTDTLFFLF